MCQVVVSFGEKSNQGEEIKRTGEPEKVLTENVVFEQRTEGETESLLDSWGKNIQEKQPAPSP